LAALAVTTSPCAAAPELPLGMPAAVAAAVAGETAAPACDAGAAAAPGCAGVGAGSDPDDASLTWGFADLAEAEPAGASGLAGSFCG
jgi:hypothetical protein